MEGTQIGSYRIERTIGTGGFGVVYVGVDVRLNRRAAIKQLLPELSGHREIVERFFNEAKAAASINHPGIVEIYDVGWHTDGSAYFAMKLLDGDSLGKRLRATGPMPVQLAATIARQVSSALVAAHASGIVHRDLKPDNIILVRDDEIAIGERAIVLDFGIAKLFGDKPASQKTRTGMMMGTPSYMSPEQCRGAGEVDHRTDVYALGCIIFEMLTGKPPFTGEGAGEVLGKHQFVAPPMLRSLRPDVSPDFEAVVMRTLTKRPEERFQQMSELTAVLQSFATGGRSMEHPVAHASSPPRSAVAAVNALPTGPVAAGQPSTLSSSRGERLRGDRPAARSNRRGVVIGLAAAVTVGAGIATAVVLSGGSPANQTAAPADAAAVASTDAAAAASPDAAVIAKLEVDAAPSVPAAPDAAGSSTRPVPDVVGNEVGGVAGGPGPPLPPAQPVTIPPTLLEGRRIRGNKNIGPDAATKSAFANSGKDKLVGSYKLCLDAQGAIASISQLKSTGFPDYDAKIQTTMRQWAYKPYLVDGKAVPVCTAVTFLYAQEASPPPSSCDFEALKEQGNNRASAGAYAAALAAYEQALKCKFDPQVLTKAYMNACNSQNAPKAKIYFKQLPAVNKGQLSQVCIRNGIDPE